MRTIKLLAAIQRAQLVAGSIGAAQAMLLGAMRRGAIRTWFAKVEIVRSGGGELVDRLSMIPVRRSAWGDPLLDLKGDPLQVKPQGWRSGYHADRFLVNETDLCAWLAHQDASTVLAEPAVDTPFTPVAPKRSRNPAGYEAADSPLIAEMREMVQQGMTPWAAACALSERASGGSSKRQSKAKRLLARYYK